MRNATLLKKIFAMTAAAAMVVSLAACGSSGGSAPAATTAAAAEAPAEAASGAAIKIGGSGPLTGGAAVYGIAVKNAAELAVEEKIGRAHV